MRKAATGRAACAARMVAALVLVGGWTLGGPAAAAETVEQAPPAAEPLTAGAPLDPAEAGEAEQAAGAPGGSDGPGAAAYGAEGGEAAEASEQEEGAPGGSAVGPPAETASELPEKTEPEHSRPGADPLPGDSADAADTPDTPDAPDASSPSPSAPTPSASPSPAQERGQSAAPQLSISKSVSPNPMVIGDEATYTITVTNNGDETAEDVTVTDTLDSNVGFVSASAGCSASGQTVTCGGTGTELAAGDSLTYTITVQVDPGVSDGTNITNPASVTASNAQGAQAQNIAQTQTQTDVEITKTGDPATVNPDGTITYTIVVTNHGPSEAVDVFVQDPTNGNLTTITGLPDQCPPSGLTISCDLGTLQPGESVELEVTVAVNSDVAEGTEIVNCATVYTGSRETDTDNNQSCASTDVGPPDEGRTDLAVRKTGPATVKPDGTITYTVTVTNNGADTAEDVHVQDRIDTDHTTIESLPDECDATGPRIDCSLGDISAGETVELTIVLHADADDEPGTIIHNCAEAHGTTRDTAIRNNVACLQTEVEDEEPSPSPSPTPSPTTSPSPTPSPSPTGEPTDDPSPTPGDGPTDGGDGYDDGGGGTGPILPVTGAGAAALGAVGLLVAASGLLLRWSAAQRANRRRD